MGFVDKLKNIFFEEEEEEEEVVDTRPPKKEKEKETDKEIIAKRVELPKRKKEEPVINEPSKEVKEDFLEIKQEVPKKEEIKKEPPKKPEMIFDDEDFILEQPKKVEVKETSSVLKEKEVRKPLPKEEFKKAPPIYEYTRQERETKKTFTPSPIISPIYGILDKNYKKEEVKERKEVRIYSRSERMDLDSVRNKAFGDLESELFDNTPTSNLEIEEEKETIERPTRDMRKLREEAQDDKPAIDKVTLGEADEYFNDLGLAYNTDYKDISKDINDGKVPTVKKDDDSLEDNLFDLIESMYDKED